MRIAISGSSGLIGSALAAALRSDRHDVVALVRRPSSGGHELQWDPATALDPSALRGVDAVVHLAGAGVGDRRWSDAYKREILDSRVRGTAAIASAVAAAGVPTLVCGSAIGWYGDTGDRAVDESAPCGSGFLADVVRQWEAAAQPAIDAGVRVAFARTGLVMTKRGGAMGRVLPIFKLGLGGPLGSGRQYWSSISLADEVRALRFLLDTPAQGIFNLTAPTPVTNAEFTRALAQALHRPAFLPVPAVALRLVVGEFASEILGSQRVLPRRLLEAGFTFQDDTVERITASLL